MFVGDAVIETDPFVAVVIGSHAVVEHISSFLH